MLSLITYLPGAGGNHLKNLLCLWPGYANRSDLTPEVYENPSPERPPGEVWCVGGRNLQPIFFDRMTNSQHNWVLAAHVGEMFQYQSELSYLATKQVILITIDQLHERRQLETRQQRLGQQLHPYWLDEELVWLYRPDFIAKHFDLPSQNIFTVPLNVFWARNFVQSQTFLSMQQFLNINLDFEVSNRYHQLWCAANKFE